MIRVFHVVAIAVPAVAFVVGGSLILQPAANQPPLVRKLKRDVLASRLPALDKRLIANLCSDAYAWDSGLIQTIAGDVAMRQIVWHDSYSAVDGTPRRVFLLDSFVRPVAATPVPPLLVVTDGDLNLINWRLVCPWSMGFQAAELSRAADGPGHRLTVRTLANWFRGTITHPYEIRHDKITDVGQVYTGPWSDAVSLKEINGDPPSLEKTLLEIRATRQTEDGAFRSPIPEPYEEHGLDYGSGREAVHKNDPPTLSRERNVEAKRWADSAK